MEVNQELYNKLLEPSRTRSGVQPIINLPIEKRRLTYKMIMNPYHRVNNLQGLKSSELYDADSDAGKYYYIHIDPYNPSFHSMLNEVSPILVHPKEFDINSFYNYMVLSIVGKNKKTKKSEILSIPTLYAVKVVNMFEFGSKHNQILYRLALQDKELLNELMKSYDKVEYVLYAAGEIRCDSNSKLFFNFYSGTYKMKRHISKRRFIYEAAYITYLIQKNGSTYMNIFFQHSSILNVDMLKLTKKELSRLRKHNVSMLLCDNQEQCKNILIEVIRYKNQNKTDVISDENLQFIYRKIMNEYIN
jgi:hypothetical protein